MYSCAVYFILASGHCLPIHTYHLQCDVEGESLIGRYTHHVYRHLVNTPLKLI